MCIKTQEDIVVNPYLIQMKNILENGHRKEDRTGTGTLSLFGTRMNFNLLEGFPLLTTKGLHTRSIIHELLWFLKGDTNIRYLVENDVSIWNEWADSNGDLGPVYGAMWRSWPTEDGKTVDQISTLIQDLKSNPDSRRLMVVAYNPGLIDKVALPPCHAMFQFWTRSLALKERMYYLSDEQYKRIMDEGWKDDRISSLCDGVGIPRRGLSCQLYQRKPHCAFVA